MSRIAGADVLIGYVLYLASLAGVRLDAYYVLVESIRSIREYIADQHALRPGVGFTADRHTVALKKMVVGNRYIRDVPHTRFDGNVVISNADMRVRNCNIVGAGGID